MTGLSRAMRVIACASGLMVMRIAHANDDVSGIFVIVFGAVFGGTVLAAWLLYFVLRWVGAPYLRASLRLLVVVACFAPVPTYPGICPAGMFWVWLALASSGDSSLAPVREPSAGFFATAIAYVILLLPLLLWTRRRERLRSDARHQA